MAPHRLNGEGGQNLIESIRLIKLGLWQHAAILIGEVDTTMERRDSNIHDIVVRVYWRDNEDLIISLQDSKEVNFRFYVDI